MGRDEERRALRRVPTRGGTADTTSAAAGWPHLHISGSPAAMGWWPWAVPRRHHARPGVNNRDQPSRLAGHGIWFDN